MVVWICSVGIRRGTILLSIRGMIPIGTGMTPGIIATMDGTALGTTPGIMVAITGIVLIGMVASITVAVTIMAVACMPATATRVLLT